MYPSKFWTRSISPETKSSPDDVKPSYQELVIGVWRVLVVKDARYSMFNLQWKNLSSTFPLLRRALHDVYSISPRLFALRILAEFWFAIESPLSLYFTNLLFSLIEKKLSGGSADDQTQSDLYMAVLLRVACSAFTSYMRWSSERDKIAYSSRIKYVYQARVFAARLAYGLDNTAPNVDVEDVFRCLERGITMMKHALSFILHVRFFAHTLGTGLNDGGPVFLAICVLPPAMRHLMSSDLWTKAYLVDAINKFYIRKCSLEKFASEGLKQEVMAGGISKFLSNEYHKAQDGLGDTPDTSAEWLYSQQREGLSDMMMSLSSDGPTLFFAFLALLNPSKLSMTQLAVLNQASTSLSYTLSSIVWDIDFWPGCFSRMMNVYTALDAKSKMKDGETPFPRPGYEESAGIGIEVRDVSFSYPSSKSERPSLSNVSFTIKPGQLVVIVGTNGSGKSTIIKLLNRFYEPTSGSILIDGIPIEEYSVSELRNGIAMLTQEHQLYPLSLEENVKLGASHTEAMDDRQKVEEAVAAAGAESIIKGFADGYDTVLDPVSLGYVSYAGEGNKELSTMQENLQKPADVSGGEKQKLVAARTFMRLFTSRIKLVTVDEPSSALDPEAEYRLFANLRKERKGRTMIFVTHRFGHLTKHADLIICIKDGVVVETGTHADLMSNSGEYAHLYNIQAEAFETTLPGA